FNYTGSRSKNPYDTFSTVPTLAERSGDFSNAKILSGPNAGAPVVIINPQTHLPFPGNMIPTIDPVAAGLLNFIPKPNLPGDFQNFHFAESVDSHLDSVNVRLVHSFGGGFLSGVKGIGGGGGRGGGRGGARNNLNVGFRFQNTGNNLTNPFPSVGGTTSVRGFDINVGYVRSFGKLTNNARADFNRNRITTQNLYAFSQNVTGLLGINGVSQNPLDFGLPNLSFTNFAGLRDINPLRRRDQTLSFSDSLIYPYKKHTWRWGGDFRRIELNPQTDSNARGSFTFTGFNTGFDFADFLLGLPQSTSVQFGNNSYHFRGNSWDLFVQDEWRLRANVTLNLGLRYEYVSPYSEINNLLVNLDVAPGFTAVAPVIAGQSGPFTGTFPQTLVNPDRNNLAPRAGFAWKPLKSTVVRGGYGINYNTGAYGSIAQQLAFQPPFSVTQTNIESPALALTLANGFPAAPPSTITNNYAVNRDYRLGYVQMWNLDIQHQFRPTLFMNLDYTGTKGTHLDIVEAPNRGPSGLLIPNVQSYLFEDSVGDSVAHAGSIRVRKRLQGGVSLGGSYTYSKSIDNASSIGGGATVVAQNAFDLGAERGLSSFDQRQRFTADYLLELPFGHDRRWLRQKSIASELFGDWHWSGDWTIASGLPFTPRVLGDFTDVSRGTNGTLRANLTGQPIALSSPSVAEWFNISAFTRPGPGQFGNAGRNIVTGPGTLVFNMGFTRVVPMGDIRVLEIRAQASNVFNRPQFTSIDAVVNSPTYGRVLSAGSMRKIQLVTRFRF
ncbi:MAG TPA: TonB-dependent receptor, partial [Candidatus Acidoferrales bacterium]|nr:TonB-dependent receptor [Candidatus Acidoferrales bacterium]